MKSSIHADSPKVTIMIIPSAHFYFSITLLNALFVHLFPAPCKKAPSNLLLNHCLINIRHVWKSYILSRLQCTVLEINDPNASLHFISPARCVSIYLHPFVSWFLDYFTPEFIKFPPSPVALGEVCDCVEAVKLTPSVFIESPSVIESSRSWEEFHLFHGFLIERSDCCQNHMKYLTLKLVFSTR